MNIDKKTYAKATLYKPGTGYGPKKRNPSDLRAIVIHTTNGKKGTTLAAEANYLYKSKEVSSQFLVGKQGEIIQFLDPLWVAWHAGTVNDIAYSNAQSIGIENHFTPGEQWTSHMHASLTDLVVALLIQFPTIQKIDTHRAVATPKGRKIDPSGWPDSDFYPWRDTVFILARKQTFNFFAQNNLPIYEGPAETFPIALGGTAFVPSGTYYEVDEDKGGGWWHLKNGVGFVNATKAKC